MKHRYHQPAPATQHAPEFYENGPVVTISTRERSIAVFRDGISRLAVGETVYRTPMDFRSAFNDATLPADEPGEVTWHNNGWFDLYEDRGDEFVHLDEIQYNLSDAIDAAVKRLTEEG